MPAVCYREPVHERSGDVGDGHERGVEGLRGLVVADGARDALRDGVAVAQDQGVEGVQRRRDCGLQRRHLRMAPTTSLRVETS